MSRKKVIDEMDINIINIMQSDGRISNKDLAAKIGLSEGPTLTRVSKLREKGIIETVSVVNLDWFGFSFQTVLEVSIKASDAEDFLKRALELPNLLNCTKIKREIRFAEKYTGFLMCFAHTSANDFLSSLKDFMSSLPYPLDYKVFEVVDYPKKLPTINLSVDLLK